MIDPSAYPRPVPMSSADAVAYLMNPTPGVSGTFLTFVMIPAEQRIGEWRFAGATRSLAAAFAQIAEFEVELGLTTPEKSRDRVADWVPHLDVWNSLAEGWSGSSIPYLDGLRTPRVVFFGEGGAPYDDFGLAILEIEPADAEPFFARAPETQWPDPWLAYHQEKQQREASGEE